MSRVSDEPAEPQASIAAGRRSDALPVWRQLRIALTVACTDAREHARIVDSETVDSLCALAGEYPEIATMLAEAGISDPFEQLLLRAFEAMNVLKQLVACTPCPPEAWKHGADDLRTLLAQAGGLAWVPERDLFLEEADEALRYLDAEMTYHRDAMCAGGALLRLDRALLRLALLQGDPEVRAARRRACGRLHLLAEMLLTTDSAPAGAPEFPPRKPTPRRDAQLHAA
ncbi:MAG: hypothetical protein ABFC67_00050 [Mizugakiibacter sp.]|uniref:hypothetical protein n=1 Tax=Mizugakiibacter sp. TaxID=1972610 RepID=UPI0031C847EA|nr:hypothetical protein [Xanthomonadaceae bacterium]